MPSSFKTVSLGQGILRKQAQSVKSISIQVPSMNQRKRTLPPKLKRVSNEIIDAINEAKKIGEISIQEEVLVELEKVNAALEQAKKEIARIMNE
jgi:guanylate kinase